MRIVLAVLLATLGAAGAAGAAEVHVTPGGAVRFTAAAGDKDWVDVDIHPKAILVADAGVAVRAGTGCTAVSASSARCPRGPLTVALGDGDDDMDRITCRGVPIGDCGVTVLGGPGDDVLAGGPGRDVLDGGPGLDNINGYGATDVMRGGSGPDFIRTLGAGAEPVDCGPGFDRFFPVAGPPPLVARNCEGFGETGFGYSSFRVQGTRLAMAIKTLGCRIFLRVGRHGPIRRVPVRPHMSHVGLRIPDPSRPIPVWSRSVCAGTDTGFRELFAIAPHV